MIGIFRVFALVYQQIAKQNWRTMIFLEVWSVCSKLPYGSKTPRF